MENARSAKTRSDRAILRVCARATELRAVSRRAPCAAGRRARSRTPTLGGKRRGAWLAALAASRAPLVRGALWAEGASPPGGLRTGRTLERLYSPASLCTASDARTGGRVAAAGRWRAKDACPLSRVVRLCTPSGGAAGDAAPRIGGVRWHDPRLRCTSDEPAARGHGRGRRCAAARGRGARARALRAAAISWKRRLPARRAAAHALLAR